MKPIPDFPNYFADENGGVFSMKLMRRSAKPPTEPRLLKLGKDGGGYLIVGLHKDGKQYTRKVHQLILETFVGPRPPGMEACHNNGDPSDNRLQNLRWDTPKNNHADRKIHGTLVNGEKHYKAKLNEMQVRVIRRCIELGMIQQVVADIFGTSQCQVSDIIRRKTWKYLG
jgi:hypothetical protein